MLSLTCMPNLQALSTFRTDLKRLDEKAALKINVFAVDEMAFLSSTDSFCLSGSLRIIPKWQYEILCWIYAVVCVYTVCTWPSAPRWNLKNTYVHFREGSSRTFAGLRLGFRCQALQAESSVVELQRAAEENLAVWMPSDVMRCMKIDSVAVGGLW